MILKLKNKSFTNIRTLFQSAVKILDKIVVSSKVSFGKNDFKYFIGYTKKIIDHREYFF